MSAPLNNLGLVYDPPEAARGCLYRCAQPQDESAFEMLDRLSLSIPFAIVRVSNDDEGSVTLAEEATMAGANRVMHAPVGYPFPTKDQAHVVADSIEELLAAGRDVFVHCKRGHDRTRFAVVAWQVKHGGMSIDEALKASEPFFDAIDHVFDAQMTHVLREFAEGVSRA